MEQKILYISAIGYDTFDSTIAEYLQSYANGSEVGAVSLKKAPHHLEYLYYGALVGPELLNTIKKAEIDGYDAAVIGCFYDPFLYEAREIAKNIVVTAPCESSLSLAAKLGNSFSIIAGRRKVIPPMMENVRKYGFRNKLASFRSVDLGVLEFQGKKELAKERILTEAMEAVEKDGAEVIILGCTKEFGFFTEVQEKIGVPVIDSMIAAYKEAGLLADVRNRLGWKTSKTGGYESPKSDEIIRWELDKYFQMEDLWKPEDL